MRQDYSVFTDRSRSPGHPFLQKNMPLKIFSCAIPGWMVQDYNLIFTEKKSLREDIPSGTAMLYCVRVQNRISSRGNRIFGIGRSAAYPSGQSMTGTRGAGIFRILVNSSGSNPPIGHESNPSALAPFRAFPSARYVWACDQPNRCSGVHPDCEIPGHTKNHALKDHQEPGYSSEGLPASE